jgi:uncharacterized membrane protein
VTGKFPTISFLFLLACDVTNALLQKLASNGAGGEGWSYLLSLLEQPWVWLALALGPIQLWIWNRVLSKADMSLAQPLTSLSYPLTVLAAVGLFHERLPLQVWVGAGLITVGAVILSARQRRT